MSREAGQPADRYWMEQTLALAALGEGATSPNPLVGCLLVREQRMVGAGYHAAHGAMHAEAVAVRQAGEAAGGATAYVNLEPCAHHGCTPPCADLLTEARVARVVAALRDPNPIVDGRGFERLRAAGVQVDVGLLADQARLLNRAFLHRHATGLPRVTVKAAASLDGMIAARGGQARWITGEAARCFAHRLRLRHDAVLVGAGTVRRDDPRLTVRLPGLHAPRARVVLAPTFDLDPALALFRPQPGLPPARVYGGVEPPDAVQRAFDGKACLVRVAMAGPDLDLRAVLEDLASSGVQSVLVEGGARTSGSFLEAGLVDDLALFYSDRLLGARGATPLLDLQSVAEPAAGWRLDRPLQLALGADRLLLGALRNPARSR